MDVGMRPFLDYGKDGLALFYLNSIMVSQTEGRLS